MMARMAKPVFEEKVFEEKEYKLKRELGFWETSLTGIGIILGAGIYALVGKATALGGEGVWISFLIAAMVAALTGLSYAELSSMFPRAGGEYAFAKESFGRRVAFLVGWVILVSGVFSAAAVAIGFGGYFMALAGGTVILPAILLMLACTLILLWGVKQSTRIGVAFTLVEAAGLIMIIAIGLPHLGSVNFLEVPNPIGVMQAAALIFFAFIGFEEISRLSEETRNPEKTIPRALIFALVVSTVLYVLVAMASLGVLGAAALGASEAPLADVAATALGGEAFTVLAIIALFSTANTVLLFMLATTRIMYGMGRDRAFPKILAKVHKTRRTPWVATLVLGGLAGLAVFMKDISILANLSNFSIFITFIIVNAAAIYLRMKKPGLRRPFRIPIGNKYPVFPVLGILTCIALLLNVGLEVMMYGTVLIVMGIVAHEILERRC